MTRLAAVVSACLLFSIELIEAGEARAEDEAPESITGSYSAYEKQTLSEIERRLGTRVDPAPEGKIIERIDIVALDVIDSGDPEPHALDALHTTTKPYVIRREVLLHEGDPYSKVLADETARNLRLLPQLSIVMCEALAGSEPDKVRLVVITKDVWSLYPDFDLVVSGGLKSLLLEPKETNVGGTHQTAFGRLWLDPKSYALGGGYSIPRLAGQWVSLSAESTVAFNRSTGEGEGSHGLLVVEAPLRSARSEWSWFTAVGWRREISRTFNDTDVRTFGSIPFEWHTEQALAAASITRSFGWATKNDFSFTFGASYNAYRPMEYLAGRNDDETRAYERDILPVSDNRVGPAIEWHGYGSDFLRVFDLETLGLQEDYRLGHDLVARFYPVRKELGSTRNFMGLYAAAQYTVAIGDGLARAVVETLREGGLAVDDGRVTGNVRIASPSLGFGRLIYDSLVVYQFENSLNTRQTLNADGRLRGYRNGPQEQNLLVSNIEIRSRSLDLRATQVGLVAFHDAGDSPRTFQEFRLKHSVGFGLRAVFPQIERAGLRVDVGFPLLPGPEDSAFKLTIAFGQAFDLHTIKGVAPPDELAY